MLVENVLQKKNKKIKTQEPWIKIEKNNGITYLKNTIREKEYGFCYDKREIDIKSDQHIDSLPYGY